MLKGRLGLWANGMSCSDRPSGIQVVESMYALYSQVVESMYALYSIVTIVR